MQLPQSRTPATSVGKLRACRAEKDKMKNNIDILDQICLRADEFIKAMPKKLRKEYGQFFTGVQTARY